MEVEFRFVCSWSVPQHLENKSKRRDMQMMDFEAKIEKTQEELATVKTELSVFKSELAAMREKISFFSVIYDKFDKTLEKLDTRQAEDRKELHAMMDDLRLSLESSITDELEKLRKDMKEQHNIERDKIDALNKWRWLVTGGAVVVGWLLSKLGLPFSMK